MSNDQSEVSFPAREAIGDPARLRELSRWAVIVSVTLHFTSVAGWIPFSDAIYILTWVAMPLIGIALGLGTAHILRHGLGLRRAIAQLAVGTILVQIGLTIQAVVEIHTKTVAGQAVTGLVHLLVYIGALITVGAAVGLLVGVLWPGLLKRLRDFERSDV